MSDLNITHASSSVLTSQSFNVASNVASNVANHVASELSQTTVPVAVSVANSTPTTQVSELKREGEQQQLSAEVVKAAAATGNTILQATNKNLQFQVDEATKQVVVKIVDSKTGEVVRQIPTVEMLDFIRAMKEQETNTGKLYRARA